jgi:hypothetical protein
MTRREIAVATYDIGHTTARLAGRYDVAPLARTY